MTAKKLVIVAVAIILMAGGYYLSMPSSMSKECAFCDQAILDYQKFYEDGDVIALYTHKPVAEGHCLIIPKRHVERFENLSDAEVLSITHAIKRVHHAVSKVFGTTSYLLLQKNGLEVGQTVPHVHFHYIPRKTGEYSTLTFLFRFYTAALMPPISKNEMREAVSKLQGAIAE